MISYHQIVFNINILHRNGFIFLADPHQRAPAAAGGNVENFPGNILE